MPSLIVLVSDGVGFSHLGTMFQNQTIRDIYARCDRTYLVNTSPASFESPSNAPYHVRTTGLHPVTESASSASAMSTGKWVPRHAVSHDGSTDAKTIGEIARDAGMKCGVICSTDFSDATPAAFFAHAPHRRYQMSICSQILQFGLTVLVSGGDFFARIGSHPDSLNRLPPFTKILPNRSNDDTSSLRTYSIGDAIDSALVYLKRTRDPFFLLIEEGDVDIKSRRKDVRGTAREMSSLAETVKKLVDFTSDDNNDTTLVILSNHATGAAVIQNDGGDNSLSDANRPLHTSSFRINSRDHDGHIVPLFIAGSRSDVIEREFPKALIDMVDVNRILRTLINTV